MASSILTRNGYKKLAEELDYLRHVKRPEIIEMLIETREGNDFEDNPEGSYYLIIQEQAFIEGRILDLENLLSNPTIVDPCEHGGTVEIGATVTIRENGFQEEAFEIVGPAEASPSEGRISYLSPLGCALLGRCPGEEVTVRAPKNTYTVTIVKVE